uniref:Probable nicotinate-nucleotide adenylyltransferase n=1 Tax=candidate division WOR-3 bacterium TaxID=2052148 RepID=A0A7C4UAK6_UNCW3
MICIFGGSFDPIHLGHIIPLKDLQDYFDIKKVIFVPANISPFKEGRNFASSEHRINMIKISIKGDEFFDVSDYEIKKGGVSYTIDTLRYFKSEYNKIGLIIGEDNLKDFRKWKEWEEILKLSKVFVLRRKGYKGKIIEGMIPVNSRIIEISSSEIRERIISGKEIRHLVKEGVAEYIYKNRLYHP